MPEHCKVQKVNKCQNKGESGHADAFVSIGNHGCAKATSIVELEFYRDAYKKKLPIVPFMPKYLGTCETEGMQRVKLENLVHGMKKPRMLDIKLGKHSAYIDEIVASGKSVIAAFVKTAKMRVSDFLSTSETMSFRIVGGNFLDEPRFHVQAMTPEYVLTRYFEKDKKNVARVEIVRRLKQLYQAIDHTKTLSMIGASILLVYDEESPRKVRVNLIDFAHSRLNAKERETKEECLKGVRNLVFSIILLD
jgi:hypothetical protein